jgi:molybdopterin synthase catalytic subunit
LKKAGLVSQPFLYIFGRKWMYIKIVDTPISPEAVIAEAKTSNSGCVVSYVGLIRDNSHEKPVLSVEYRDQDGQAQSRLTRLADEIAGKFPVNNLAMVHRVGVLKVGDINIVFAFACGHRQEGFAACAYAVDRFKDSMPTQKKETYLDGTVTTDW